MTTACWESSISVSSRTSVSGSPDKSLAEAERWAARIKGPGYAMDDQTAVKVTDGSVEVISEGHWKLLNPAG